MPMTYEVANLSDVVNHFRKQANEARSRRTRKASVANRLLTREAVTLDACATFLEQTVINPDPRQPLLEPTKNLLSFLDEYPHQFAVDIGGHIQDVKDAIEQVEKSGEETKQKARV